MICITLADEREIILFVPERVFMLRWLMFGSWFDYVFLGICSLGKRSSVIAVSEIWFLLRYAYWLMIDIPESDGILCVIWFLCRIGIWIQLLIPRAWTRLLSAWTQHKHDPDSFLQERYERQAFRLFEIGMCHRSGTSPWQVLVAYWKGTIHLPFPWMLPRYTKELGGWMNTMMIQETAPT